MTKVINLFGGPCSGKSTTAAGLFYQLKKKHIKCELVREYIKDWAWDGRVPSQFDQPYIAGKQMKYESSKYGKVDYIVTDSPFMLADFYEMTYNETRMSLPTIREMIAYAQGKGVEYVNFFLPTVDTIDEEGRYEDRELIIQRGAEMRDWLDELESQNSYGSVKSIDVIATEPDKRLEEIMNHLGFIRPTSFWKRALLR